MGEVGRATYRSLVVVAVIDYCVFLCLLLALGSLEVLHPSLKVALIKQSHGSASTSQELDRMSCTHAVD